MSSTTNPRQTRLANIPEEAVKNAYENLDRIISPEDDDRRIRNSLNLIWFCVRDALKQDPKLKEHLADEKEFLANVKRKGEEQFIESLGDIAMERSWERLFDDGTLFSSFGSKHSGHPLFLDVFLKKKADADSLEEVPNTALVEGTQ
jgi:hypothetical protein